MFALSDSFGRILNRLVNRRNFHGEVDLVTLHLALVIDLAFIPREAQRNGEGSASTVPSSNHRLAEHLARGTTAELVSIRLEIEGSLDASVGRLSRPLPCR